MNHKLLPLLALLLAAVACRRQDEPPAATPCADALLAYADRYPEADAQDLYKLVFQDLFGPGHLLADSLASCDYIGREVQQMASDGPTLLPPYEYTLCDSHFVRVNLSLVADGTLDARQLASAVVRSSEGLPSPDARFVLSHSAAFRQAYRPHYRIVRRDLFEQELLPLIAK